MSTIVTSQKHDLTEKKRRLSRAEMRDIIDLSLWAGQLQLQYGVDTERAETTIHRLGTGLDCDWLDVFVSPNAIVIREKWLSRVNIEGDKNEEENHTTTIAVWGRDHKSHRMWRQ